MADISGLDKAQVLAALYNAARPQGMGFMQYDPTPMSVDEARGLLQRTANFDYLKGRVMKLNFNGDELVTIWYDRDNGEGSAEMVINSLRATSDVNNKLIQRIHEVGTQGAIQFVRQHMSDKGHASENGGQLSITLGYDDVARFLSPKVQEAQDILDDKRGTVTSK